MLAATVDWTQVLIIGVPAYIAALGGCVGAWRGTQNRTALKATNETLQTPSGDSIGAVAERTHDLAAVSVAAVTGTNGPEVTKAMAKLDADPKAPVNLPPGTLDKAT